MIDTCSDCPLTPTVRRQLGISEKQDFIANELLTSPDGTSPRTIAAKLGVSKTSVIKVRKKLISVGQVGPLEFTVGRDGKRYKVKRDDRKYRPFSRLQSEHTDAIHAPQSEFSSPDWLFDHFDKKLNFNFTLDVCATPENAKCKKFFTIDDDGLSQQSWAGETCWMNPPYHRHIIGSWVERAFFESRQPDTTVVCLLRTSFRDYGWWKKFCLLGRLDFIHPFVRFQRSDGEGSALIDVVVIVFGIKYKPLTSGPVIGKVG